LDECSDWRASWGWTWALPGSGGAAHVRLLSLYTAYSNIRRLKLNNKVDSQLTTGLLGYTRSSKNWLALCINTNLVSIQPSVPSLIFRRFNDCQLLTFFSQQYFWGYVLI